MVCKFIIRLICNDNDELLLHLSQHCLLIGTTQAPMCGIWTLLSPVKLTDSSWFNEHDDLEILSLTSTFAGGEDIGEICNLFVESVTLIS